MPTLKEPEASLSYVQCFLYLVSSSINVFFIVYGWVLSGQTSLYIRKEKKEYSFKSMKTNWIVTVK